MSVEIDDHDFVEFGEVFLLHNPNSDGDISVYTKAPSLISWGMMIPKKAIINTLTLFKKKLDDKYVPSAQVNRPSMLIC